MFTLDKRKSIDLLVEQFWKLGYLSISRKFGRYLPEPERIGNFDIDVVARYNKDYAIGITISSDDLKDPGFLEKISYLATRQTKFSNNKVQLFIGIPSGIYKKAGSLLENIDPVTKKNIRILRITGKEPSINKKTIRRKQLFS